jgi:predicted metal-dependent hydrolase
MYIDISHKDLGRIHNTVVHELLHFKYPDMEDGPKFNKLVTKTLMGKGKGKK